MAICLDGQVSSDSLLKQAKTIVYDQPNKSINIALQLLKKEKEIDKLAHLYMLISNAYIVKRNNDSSLFYILKAKDLINTNALPSTKIKILNSVAVQYQQMELYDNALEILDQAQKMADQLPLNSTDQLFNNGFINAVRGMIYRNQSNPDLALKKFSLAVGNFHKLERNKSSSANLSIVYYNMGNCYIDLLQLPQATSYFKKAEEYAKMFNITNLEAYALKGEGESLFLSHQFQESLNVLYLAEKLSASNGDLVLNQGIYKLLSNNNLALNDFQKFQNYNTQFLEVQEKLEQNELKSLTRYLDTQSKEEQEITDKVTKQFSIYQIIIALIALIALVFLLIKFLQLKKRNHRQKKIIETLTKSQKVV